MCVKRVWTVQDGKSDSGERERLKSAHSMQRKNQSVVMQLRVQCRVCQSCNRSLSKCSECREDQATYPNVASPHINKLRQTKHPAPAYCTDFFCIHHMHVLRSTCHSPAVSTHMHTQFCHHKQHSGQNPGIQILRSHEQKISVTVPFKEQSR